MTAVYLSLKKTPITAESYVESIGDVKIEKYAILKKLQPKTVTFYPLLGRALRSGSKLPLKIKFLDEEKSFEPQKNTYKRIILRRIDW